MNMVFASVLVVSEQLLNTLIGGIPSIVLVAPPTLLYTKKVIVVDHNWVTSM